MGALQDIECSPPPPPYTNNETPTSILSIKLPRRFRSLRIVVVFVIITLLTVSLFWAWDKQHQGTLSPTELQFQAGLAACAALTTIPTRLDPDTRTANPRWNPTRGQSQTVMLRNATLFDGVSFHPQPVDIVFSKGLITAVHPAARRTFTDTVVVVDLHGAHVTPGLVDMHSHHAIASWPVLDATDDSNEIDPTHFGPLTPFLRALDGIKAYDPATRLVASGGVTSSLIIPGSANIMGGEGAVVKNVLRPEGEFVVEEMLLEHGVEAGARHRYMKMACGENPKVLYQHTRMGNVWLLRQWLARAKALVDKQDAWCAAAVSAGSSSSSSFPEELELESTAAMLRGRVAMHNHCYEPQDMETMLRVSHEFGFRVRAFHHAIEAWQVPEMLKAQGGDNNLTIATFAEFALYKHEAYDASLWAGKILNDHGIPVAYKSDHGGEISSAQYLLSQAAVAHSFGLPPDKALAAVSSVPARAIDLDDRVGFVRAGYDADVVVWDAHPLSVGATPKQVYIDGVAVLDPKVVDESMAHVVVADSEPPAMMRATVVPEEREEICARARLPGQTLVVTGIQRTFLPATQTNNPQDQGPFTLVMENGTVICFDTNSTCSAARLEDKDEQDMVLVALKNGHLTTGLTAVTFALGLAEITMDPSTGDGVANLVKPSPDATDIPFAKYAVSLGGAQVQAKTFARARLGGVTRAVQAPLTSGGWITGVSTGLRTGLHSTLLNGGLFRDDVALHVVLGDEAMANDGTVGMAVEKLRGLLRVHGEGGSGPWARVANGSLPLVVAADSNHDIQQVIILQKDFPTINTVIYGGHEAHLFAKELATAKIPIILTANRGGPDKWTKRTSLPGPPLSRSPADILTEAGVLFAIAINTDGGPPGDSRIQSLAQEASWAAKYAGLDDVAAMDLVTRNVEAILGLEASEDIVVWEGSPLQFGGTPVLGFQAELEEQGGAGRRLVVGSCWPNDADE